MLDAKPIRAPVHQFPAASAVSRGCEVVLDADPDLAQDLDQPALAQARRRTVARVVEAEGPTWDPRSVIEPDTTGWLGILVLNGLMIRRVGLGKRAACELLGPGDIFRPWDADGPYDPLPVAIGFQVVHPGRLAILDAAFALRIAPWPAVTGRIVSRVACRARNLALFQAVSHLPRTQTRLLVLFWLLADRWGRVGVNGVILRLRLTHEILAMLVGTNRPTVTIALKHLSSAGLLTRDGRECWLLTHRAINLLSQPERLADLADEDV